MQYILGASISELEEQLDYRLELDVELVFVHLLPRILSIFSDQLPLAFDKFDIPTSLHFYRDQVSLLVQLFWLPQSSRPVM